MKCLVTGGGGFLGMAVVRKLVERGHQVRTFQRQRYAALEALSGVECVQGDLADRAAVAGAARGVDTVFHVAAKLASLLFKGEIPSIIVVLFVLLCEDEGVNVVLQSGRFELVTNSDASVLPCS